MDFQKEVDDLDAIMRQFNESLPTDLQPATAAPEASLSRDSKPERPSRSHTTTDRSPPPMVAANHGSPTATAIATTTTTTPTSHSAPGPAPASHSGSVRGDGVVAGRVAMLARSMTTAPGSKRPVGFHERGSAPASASASASATDARSKLDEHFRAKGKITQPRGPSPGHRTAIASGDQGSSGLTATAGARGSVESDDADADDGPVEMKQRSKTTSAVRVFRTGMMTKRGHFIKNWKARYWILKKGRLEYYEKKDAKLKGFLTLVNCSAENASVELGVPYCIRIKTEMDPVFYVRVTSEEELVGWIRDIEQARWSGPE